MLWDRMLPPVHQHGHLEAADDGELTFTDSLPARLATVKAGFGHGISGVRFRRLALRD